MASPRRPHSPSPSPPPPMASSSSSRSPRQHHHYHHHHGQQQPIAEDQLQNIDLGGGGNGNADNTKQQRSSPKQASGAATAPQASGAGGDEEVAAGGAREEEAAAAAAAGAGAGAAGGRRSSAFSSGGGLGAFSFGSHASWLALLLAQCRRFDVELTVLFLSVIFVCTACAIFTKDHGWFLLRAPLTQPSTLGAAATATYRVGLSTYTCQVPMASGGGLVYEHQGPLDEISPRVNNLAVGVYICLVFSLLLAVGTLWYIALFYRYLKGHSQQPVNASREVAIRLLGLKATALGLLLFSLATCAFRAAVKADVAAARRGTTALGPLPSEGVDGGRLRLSTEFAYQLTVAAWLFWEAVGAVLLFRACCWATRRGEGEGGERGAHA